LCSNDTRFAATDAGPGIDTGKSVTKVLHDSFQVLRLLAERQGGQQLFKLDERGYRFASIVAKEERFWSREVQWWILRLDYRDLIRFSEHYTAAVGD